MSTITTNINDSFFDSSYKYAWKKIIPQGLTEVETELILEVASLKKGDRVLDLMCGFGRHTLELAKNGIRVVALDNLQDYISEIDESALAKGLEVEAIRSSVLTMSLKGEFDAAICMGNSFSFFNKADAITILKNVANHLKPGGTLIINTWMIAEIALKYFKEHEWHWAGDYKCVLDNQYHFYPARIESEQTIISPDGNVDLIRGIDYIYNLDELQEMFRQAGLTTNAVFSTPRKRKFELGDVRAYIVSQKN